MPRIDGWARTASSSLIRAAGRAWPPGRGSLGRWSYLIFLALVAGAIAAVIPKPAGAEGEAFVSDDFNMVALDRTRWSVVDPVGDGQVGITGAGSGDAHLSLGVPAGASHDAWTTNRSLRVMQPMADVDLDVSARFDSTPASRYQMHGFQVEYAGGYLRYGLHHNGGSLRLYAATLSGRTATVRIDVPITAANARVLRVARTGDTFTLSYSPDGATWTTATSFSQAVDVTAAGLFAGNHNVSGAPPPAYTALVDYAFNTAQPVSPEDGPATPPDDTTPPVISNVAVDAAADRATVSWTTDEPASPAVDYGPTPSFGSSASDPGLNTSHSLTLTGLTPETTYHYAVHATNAAGLQGNTPAATFATDPAPASAGLVSDDFRNGVSSSLWNVVDPVGDGSVTGDESTSCDAQAALSVPAGAGHDPWTTNRAVRMMQPVGDTDLDVSTQFTTTPSERFQSHGLLVQQSDSAYLRYGIHHDGNALRLYAATFPGNGTAVKRLDRSVSAAAAKHLRVVRAGDVWTLRHSADGNTWSTATTFTQPFDVTAAGLFAGNNKPSNGASAPAYTARADYVFDTANPVSPEDGGEACTAQPLTTSVTGEGTVNRSPNAASYTPGATVTLTAVPAPGWRFASWGGAASGTANPATVTVNGATDVSAAFVPDETPPAISDLRVTPTASTATLTWKTDDPATSQVAYGSSPAYESGTHGSDEKVTDHSVTLTGLTPGTTYHYRVTSVNGADLPSSTADATFATAPSSAPAIAVWYGDRQTVGAHGKPQNWVNVLGNVSDPDGVRSLAYTLNGGGSHSLRMGPDLRRLYGAGDFNAEIAYDDLHPGENTVVITAVDQAGETATKTVTIDRVAAQSTALPYDTNWAEASSVNERAQVVDGKWALQPDGTIRAVEPGYDRTVAIGDQSWTDYEVTATVTVHTLAPGYGTPQSGAPLVGMGLRWNGHTQVRNEQPRQHWYPTGSFMWWRWQGNGAYRLYGNNDTPSAAFTSPGMQFGTTYTFKVRATTVANGTEYRAKVWVAGTPEPANWSQTIVDDDGPASGGVLLVSHHVVADWGDVVVTPIAP